MTSPTIYSQAGWDGYSNATFGESREGRILVTGAGGFIGSAVVQRLRSQGRVVTALARKNDLHGDCEIGPTLSSRADLRGELMGIRTIFHAAAKTHVSKDHSTRELAALEEINVLGTLNLARQAAESNVQRFIFISSIKANGENTDAGRTFNVDSPLSPEDDYGLSKANAEAELRTLASETAMELVIIRPPMVYGPGVKGNFAAMMRAVARGLPLPFGAVTDNRRSLVGLDNLVDLLVTCIDHPAAANQTFMVSDGEDLSTADLLRRLGVAMGKPARLLNIPPALLGAAAAMIGKRTVAQRLLGNLQVDISHTCRTLGWKPPVSVDEGLRRAVQGAMR